MLSFNCQGRCYRWLPQRLIANLIVVLMVLFLGFYLIGNLTQAAISKEIVTITVAPEDTLWSIAELLEPEADPRPLISQIIHQNHLSGSKLTTGQNLKLVLEATNQDGPIMKPQEALQGVKIQGVRSLYLP